MPTHGSTGWPAAAPGTIGTGLASLSLGSAEGSKNGLAIPIILLAMKTGMGRVRMVERHVGHVFRRR